MATLYIKEQGAVLRRTGERLVVTKEDQVLEDVPILHVEQVVVLGNVQLSTPAMALLLQRDVDVVFLSMYGKFRGRLVSTGSRFAVLRHAQLQLLSREAPVLALAQAVVLGKLHNQTVLLSGLPNAQIFITRLRAASGQAQQTTNLETLRGYEGAAGAAYFEGLRTLITPEWGFTKRIYHPPPDPVNALLSLGYSLLLKDVTAAVELVGLDPYLGFFHALDYGRPSLTLDLMEPFRPLVDGLVLQLLTKGICKPEHFKLGQVEEKPAVELQEPVLKHYLQAYEQLLAERVPYPGSEQRTSWRRCLELQARELAQVILGQRAQFVAFRMSKAPTLGKAA